MEITKNIIELLFSLALFINAILFIPQAKKIFKNKNTKDISLLIFIGFFLIQLTTIFHGFINHNYFLIIGYLLSISTCSAVVILAIIYKHEKHTGGTDITLEQVIEQMPGHVYWKSKEGAGISCNTNNWKDYGLKSLGNYIGITDYDLFPKDQADKIRKVDLQVIETGQPIVVEEENIGADGKYALYLSQKLPLRNNRNEIVGILGISFDITDARKKEIERLNVLESIIAEMPGHVFWKNRQGVFLGCNNQQAKTLGLSSWQEVVGKTTYDMVWFGQPEEERRRQAAIIDENDCKVMETGIDQILEEPLILPDGSEAIYLSKKTPLRKDTGEVIGILGISFDITDKKRTEEKLLETRKKLEGMTLVRATIAHELRTPLAAFAVAADNIKIVFPQLKQAYTWAKEREAPIEEIAPSYLAYLEEALASMTKEIQSAFTLIDISLKNTDPSLDTGKPEVLSINDIIDNALLRYPFMSGQRDLVRWLPKPETNFLVKGDKILITHVLFNLIKNALYYIAAAGKGNIRIWLEKGTPFNKVYFEDTGMGIADDVLPRIFDLFFTKTDSSVHSAGVGLTFCRKVMESLKGEIACDSVEGEYTLFTLSFPLEV